MSGRVILEKVAVDPNLSGGVQIGDAVNKAIRVNVVAGGVGGGAMTVADGADVAQGTTTDVAWVSGAGTIIALLKKIAGGSSTDVTDRTARLLGHVTVDTAPTTAVTGTFWQATQPVSAASGGLVDGAIATLGLNADAAVGDAAGTVNAHLRQIAKTLALSVAVTGTFWQATQPVSAASGGFVDGAIATLGTNADAAVGDATGTVNAHLRQIAKTLAASVAVTGTFWQATQPVSGTVIANMATGGGKTLLFAAVDVASSGDNTIVAADASNKIKVVSYVLIADAAVTAKWYSGAAGTALSGAMSLSLSSGAALAGSVDAHILETAAINKALVLNLGGAVGVRGHISYFKEP